MKIAILRAHLILETESRDDLLRLGRIAGRLNLKDTSGSGQPMERELEIPLHRVLDVLADTEKWPDRRSP